MNSSVPSGTPTILRKIIQRKLEEISARQQQVSEQALLNQARAASAVRGFADRLQDRMSQQRCGVIAEVKKASPSKGVIREHFVPAEIAAAYEAAGATCMSVLTDHDFFQGSEADLQAARAASELPVIRKDFLVSTYQVIESRAIHADCVLLIVACLADSQMAELKQCAEELGMDVLVEVHDEAELERAMRLEPRLLGINNRDLHSFDTSLDTTLRLLKALPEAQQVITESGIHKPKDVKKMLQHGVYGFLVGEAFMRHANPGEGLRALFSGDLVD